MAAWARRHRIVILKNTRWPTQTNNFYRDAAQSAVMPQYVVRLSVCPSGRDV